MSDVFISYSREDLDKVSQIAAAVTEQGYDLWWDKDLPPHLSYTEVIQEKIGGAKAVIVVWSETASKSEWVRAEADMARNQNKLVQTSIDDGMPPLPFNQIQFASLSNWSGDSEHRDWRKVLQSLADLVGRDAPPPVAAPTASSNTPAPVPPPPPEPAAATSAPGSSQLPLVISVIALTLVVAAVGWLFLGQEQNAADDDLAVEEMAASEQADQAKALENEDDNDTASNPAADSSPETNNNREFNESAVIEDADGWTNFRAGPSRSATIIGRIETGEIFYTHRQDGSWWKIRTEDGEIGYMHYSRIALTTSIAKQPKIYFPDSASRIITTEEMSRLTKSELRLARNEIFARRGRIFESADLRDHFSQFDWYEPVSAEVEINDIEKANAQAMQAAEQQR